MWGDMGDDGTQDWDIGDKLQNPAPAGFGDIDHCTTISIESIANYKTFVSDHSRDYYAAAATPSFALPRNITGRGHSPYFDPVDCMDNDGQRFALTFVLDFLDKLHQWRSSTHTGAAAVAAAPPPFPRILLLGEAGTGKSFVLRLLQSFVLIYAADASAFLVVAPTGAAGAALCAPTADRAFKFDRTAKSPAPLANEHLLTLQAFYRRLVALAGDESSMWGQIMFGNFAERCNDIFNNGRCQDPAFESAVHPFGGVPLFIFGGDFGQLPPVLDHALYSKAGTSQSARVGHRAFNSLTHFLHLDKPERQGDTCPLYHALQTLRRGDDNDADLQFWNGRNILGLKRDAGAQAELQWGLLNPQLLHATCYNRDRDNINQQYVAQGHNVVVVTSVCSGNHAISSNPRAGGQAVRIPRTSYFFVGMTVLLPVNLVPELGLANNTRGTVVEILYPAGGYDPRDTSVSPVVVVDFPGYTGRPWDPQHPTWVPVAAVERRCDRGCCSRTGVPLWPGKAGSVHSFQGLTIGDGKNYTRLVFTWDKGAEGRWPGAFYVGASRAMAPHNLALTGAMTKDDLTAVAKGNGWKAQRIQVAELLTKARNFRTELAQHKDLPWHTDGHDPHHWGSRYDFAQRIFRFIHIHRNEILQSPSLPEVARAEALSCLGQWEHSLQEARFSPYAL